MYKCNVLVYIYGVLFFTLFLFFSSVNDLCKAVEAYKEFLRKCCTLDHFSLWSLVSENLKIKPKFNAVFQNNVRFSVDFFILWHCFC